MYRSTPLKRSPDSNEYVATGDPGSQATVTHERSDLLRISVKDVNGRVWEGEIVMDSPGVGRVVWRYIDCSAGRYSFGQKSIAVHRERAILRLYLTEVEEKASFSFSKELFERSGGGT